MSQLNLQEEEKLLDLQNHDLMSDANIPSDTFWRTMKGWFNLNYWFHVFFVNILLNMKDRIIKLNNSQTIPAKFVDNKLNNQKYNFITFIPIILYNQFKFFFNLYFALLALSQIFEVLRVGFLITYISPLIFVLMITFLKEFYDDFKRYRRDKELNDKKYKKLQKDGNFAEIKSADLKVGDLIQISAGQRIPADLLLLYTDQKNGAVFIKTDQLDGETDWKLRKSIRFTQVEYNVNPNLSQYNCSILAEKPHKDIYSFKGKIVCERGSDAITLENTLWANTSLTAGTIIALVLYTGKETRSQLNNRSARPKFGILDKEVDSLSLILFAMMVFISVLTLVSSGQYGSWYTVVIRYIILYSSIIPISLRVNLDLAKLAYCYMIYKDDEMPETVARNSTIPEELGRIEYLFSDKTGTLTQNSMVFKKLFCIQKLFTTVFF